MLSPTVLPFVSEHQASWKKSLVKVVVYLYLVYFYDVKEGTQRAFGTMSLIMTVLKVCLCIHI